VSAAFDDTTREPPDPSPDGDGKKVIPIFSKLLEREWQEQQRAQLLEGLICHPFYPPVAGEDGVFYRGVVVRTPRDEFPILRDPPDMGEFQKPFEDETGAAYPLGGAAIEVFEYIDFETCEHVAVYRIPYVFIFYDEPENAQ